MEVFFSLSVYFPPRPLYSYRAIVYSSFLPLKPSRDPQRQMAKLSRLVLTHLEMFLAQWHDCPAFLARRNKYNMMTILSQ